MSAKEMVQIPREVLEKLQWYVDMDGYLGCAFCEAVPDKIGHKEDCPVGIALKQEAVPERMQYEMVVHGYKYVTILGVDKGKTMSCKWCDFLEDGNGSEDSRCCNPAKSGSIHAVCCNAYQNPDKLNRIWKKIQ